MTPIEDWRTDEGKHFQHHVVDLRNLQARILWMIPLMERVNPGEMAAVREFAELPQVKKFFGDSK